MEEKYKLEFENPKTFNFNSVKIGTGLIIKEAFRRGIKVSKEKGEFRILKYKGEKHITSEHEIDQVGRPSVRVTSEKQICKDFLSSDGISVPWGKVFESNELREAVKYFKRMKSRVVCKPATSDYGTHIFLNIDSENKLRKAFRTIAKKGYRVLIEEQFFGNEIRIFVTEKGYICAISRLPANVVGDGIHTIEQLVRMKNKEKYGELQSNDIEKYVLKLKRVEKRNLREKGLSPKSIPKKRMRVFLRYNSNLSTGGDSIDITDHLHPSIKKIAMKVIEAIPGLRYAGIDLITKKSISKPHTPKDYRIIEINNIPGIYGHHIPYKGEGRDAAGAILDLLFPKSKRK